MFGYYERKQACVHYFEFQIKMMPGKAAEHAAKLESAVNSLFDKLLAEVREDEKD